MNNTVFMVRFGVLPETASLKKTSPKIYSMSPRRYLSEYKLKKAKELLLHTNLSIEEIAEQLYFSSSFHFSKQFRRWTGVSPTHFRPKHSGKLEI
jgi:AraC family transcriptional regulator